jgi:hypothetical protein
MSATVLAEVLPAVNKIARPQPAAGRGRVRGVGVPPPTARRRPNHAEAARRDRSIHRRPAATGVAWRRHQLIGTKSGAYYLRVFVFGQCIGRRRLRRREALRWLKRNGYNTDLDGGGCLIR